MITREALRVLENNLTFTKQVNRQFSSKFGIEGAKIGTVLNVRKPPRYVGRTGAPISIEDATETSVPVTLTTQFGVDIQFSSAELGLSIDDFSDRFIKPAMATIANKIDYDGLGLYTTVPNQVGAIGTVPNTLLTYLEAGVALDNNMAPRDGSRAVVINPIMQATLVDALKGLFQSSEKIADQYESGTMGLTGGFKFSMDQNVRSHTAGPLGGAPVVSGAGQTGSSLLTSGWTAAAAARLKAGDTFTIANVYAVNGQNRQTLTTLRTFTVLSNFSSAADGTGTISIYPPIYGPEAATVARQTVSALPAASAPLTITSGTANQVTNGVGLAFHKDAFTLATADLPLPGGVDMASRVSDNQLGISIRAVRQYNISTDQFPMRLDVLYGWAPLYPELACRILS
jgi:hypothetical protein